MSRWMTPLVWAEASASAIGDRRVDRTIGTHASFAAEDLGEAAPVDVLHDDVVGAGGLAPVVDADDVRVVEVRRGLRLTPEALDERRVLRELGEEHLERDRAVEQLVSGQEDVGHASPTDPALQLVALVQNGGVGLRHVEAAYRPVESRSGAARIVCITAFAIGAATRPPVDSLAPLWFEHDHRDRDAGVVGRREADDPGVRSGRIGAELRRAGLAPDEDAGDLHPRRRAVLDDVDHRVAHDRRVRFGERPRPEPGRPAIDDLAVAVAHLLHHVRLLDHPAVRDARRDERHLQRRRLDVVLTDGGLRERRRVVVEERDGREERRRGRRAGRSAASS